MTINVWANIDGEYVSDIIDIPDYELEGLDEDEQFEIMYNYGKIVLQEIVEDEHILENLDNFREWGFLDVPDDSEVNYE